MKDHDIDVWVFKEGAVARCSCGWSRDFDWEHDYSWQEAHRHYDAWRHITPSRLSETAGGRGTWNTEDSRNARMWRGETDPNAINGEVVE